MMRKIRVYGPDLEVGDWIISCEYGGIISPWGSRVVAEGKNNRREVDIGLMHHEYKARDHIFVVEREDQENEFGPVTP